MKNLLTFVAATFVAFAPVALQANPTSYTQCETRKADNGNYFVAVDPTCFAAFDTATRDGNPISH